MDRLKDLLHKNLLVIIYVIFFIFFASIAVWDVKEIIKDYLEDNRFTLVKAKNSVAEGYPFLENPRICLHYDQPIIPGLTWDDFNAMLNDSFYQRDIVWLKNLSTGEKSASANIFNMIKYGLIEALDQGVYEYVINEMAFFLRINLTEVKVLLDAFINDAVSINLIKDALNDKIFKGRFSQNEIILRSITLNGIGRKPNLIVCVLAPLIDDMKTTEDNSVQYNLDIYSYTYGEPSLGNATNWQALIEVQFFDETIDVKIIPTKETTISINVKISNSQILDSSRFSSCVQKFKTELECLTNLKQVAVEKICQCQPFSKVEFDNKTESDRKLFCTWQIYEQCREKADVEYWRRREKAILERLCKPCLSVTNSIKVSIDEWYHMRSSDWQIYSSYALSFQCDKETYLSFEEKAQFNFSQLVSQIGGDLGLYIGFSMISILQMILFFYHLQRKRPNASNSSNGKLGEWLRLITRRFTSDVEENSANWHELKEHVRTMQRHQQETLKELKDLNEWKQKTEQLLNDFTKQLRKLHIEEDGPQQEMTRF